MAEKAKAATKAAGKSSETEHKPLERNYKVLVEFKFGGDWQEVGTTIKLNPAQAWMFVNQRKLQEVK